MGITRRTDYACRIIRAAARGEGAYVPMSKISADEQIPHAFARSIQRDLIEKGIITTSRGARGGLRLACELEDLTMLDVIEALQGPVSMSSCAVDPTTCALSQGCVFNQCFQGANHVLRSYFGSIKLSDLFDKGGEHPSIAAARTCSNSDGTPGPFFDTSCYCGLL